MADPDNRHSVSVAGVVVDRAGRALLIRRRDNAHWEAPGGILELQEPIEAGVRREIKEETGLDVDPVALTGVYKNMARGIVALVFRCTKVSGELTTNDEVTAFHWASPEEVIAMVDEAFAVRVLDALHDGRPAVRQHDGVKVL
jgi:ADP-ribose pyrophosphatase YjhB (NUDIX family)